MIHAIQTGPFSVNTYIIRLKGSDALIVDPACCKFSNDEDKFFSYLKANNLVPKVIFLTHGHFDHVAGLNAIKQKFPDVKILINSNDAHFIGNGSEILQRISLEPMNFLEFLPFVSNLPEADFLISDNTNLSSYIQNIPLLENCLCVSLCKYELYFFGIFAQGYKGLNVHKGFLVGNSGQFKRDMPKFYAHLKGKGIKFKFFVWT